MKMKIRRLAMWMAVLGLVVGFANVARAQDEGDDNQDPPSRVARLNHIEGAVSFQPNGSQDWV
jgi:hypothetical protein